MWFSPRFVIQELSKTIQKGNPVHIKKHKEAWIAAVSLLCRSEVEPSEWWIQIPKNDPPDILAMHIIKRVDGAGNSMVQQPVEVFEISEHDNESIEKSIERKLTSKIRDYSDTMVVGFVRRNSIFNHKNVSEHIKKIKHKAGAVYLIVNEENNTNYSFIGIYPDYFKYKCNWGKKCKSSSQPDFTETERSTKIKLVTQGETTDAVTLFPS
jgi:hypothetical protein